MVKLHASHVTSFETARPIFFHLRHSLQVAAGDLPLAAPSLRIVARRMAAAVAASASPLRAMRIDCVSMLCKGSSATPLRCGFVWDQDPEGKAPAQASTGKFRPDRFLRQVGVDSA